MSLLGNHSGGASSQMGLHTSGGRIPYEHLVFGDGFAFIVSARVKVVMRRIVAPLTITSDVATANEMTTEQVIEEVHRFISLQVLVQNHYAGKISGTALTGSQLEGESNNYTWLVVCSGRAVARYDHQYLLLHRILNHLGLYLAYSPGREP
jgi:hypothetical protein